MAAGPRFTVAGIPVRVEPVFFAVIVFLGLLYPPPYIVTWVVIATVSILLHELGHAAAFRCYGLRPSVTLYAMGGVTSASTDSVEHPFTPLRSIVTSLAGPLAAILLLGLPALVLAHRNGFDPWMSLRQFRTTATPSEVILAQIVYINIGWSLLNLIPVLPLDGGNVTASVCELFSPRRGRRIANVASILVAVGIGWWGFSAGFVIAPVFALMFVAINVRELMSVADDDTDEELSLAVRALLDYEPFQAEQLVRSVLARHPSGDRLRWATELSAWTRLAAGDVAGAQHALVSMPPGMAPSASVRGALALALGSTAEGVTTLAWAFAHDPSKPAKGLAAIAAAQAGQAPAVAQELVQLGPEGAEGAVLLRDLLDYTGHRADAAEVGRVLQLAAPRPPG